MLNRLFLCFNLLLLLSGSDASRSIVKYLPGFAGPLPFELETGYVGLGEAKDVQLFYYFVKSARNPKEDPLVLWFTGGPRCSSFSAFVYEIGPLYFKTDVEYDGGVPSLVLNSNSWTKVANIIFVDAPVDTGFSYSKTIQGPVVGDKRSAKDSYEFLRKWFIEHPEFLSNPLYVAGDSYSGITIPILVQEIIDDIDAGESPLLNFKGYLLGNPFTDIKLEDNVRVSFSYGMALISYELYESMKQNCEGEYPNFDTSNAECLKDLEAFDNCISGINTQNILEPLCSQAFPKPKGDANQRRSLAKFEQFISPQFLASTKCRSDDYLLSAFWANNDRVQKALHIQKGTVEEWIRCNYDIPYEKDVESTIEYHRNLSTRGYRSLIYSGDHDMSVPHISTESWIRSLNSSVVDEWRPWLVDGQVAGYTRTFSNSITYATVKGGGHTAPEYKPKECFAMFKRWISHNPL